MFQRWLGFLVLRRAYRVLLAEDPRPLRERLTHEAKRLLIAAAVVALVIGAIVAAAVVALVVYLT
jgi:hypothetical protein